LREERKAGACREIRAAEGEAGLALRAGLVRTTVGGEGHGMAAMRASCAAFGSPAPAISP